MASRAPVTYVLVPGSFTVPEEFDKVITLFEKDKQTVRAVALQTANDGTRMPPASFEDDVAHIRSSILDVLDGDKRDVVLLLHSYSGIPGSSALNGLSKSDRTTTGHDTAVIGLVYLASFVPVIGDDLRDLQRDYAQEAFLKGVPGGYFPPVAPEAVPFIFNDVKDEAERIKYHSIMVRHASDSFSGKATYEPWRVIDSVQIIPEHDLIVAVVLQEQMYQRTVKEGGKVRRLFVDGGGHCLNVSRPQLLVDEMKKLASSCNTTQLTAAL